MSGSFSLGVGVVLIVLALIAFATTRRSGSSANPTGVAHSIGRALGALWKRLRGSNPGPVASSVPVLAVSASPAPVAALLAAKAAPMKGSPMPPVTITLTPEQVAAIVAQKDSGSPGPTPTPTPAPRPAGGVTWRRPDGSQASVDLPLPGEGIMAYAIRTSAQTLYPASAAGALAQMSSTTPFGNGADPTTWPKIVDYLADPLRYMTPAERAAHELRVIASHASGPWNGPHNPETLDLYSWAFYFQSPVLRGNLFDVFDRPPVYKNNETGALFTNGDAEFRKADGTFLHDVSQYAKHGGVLAPTEAAIKVRLGIA